MTAEAHLFYFFIGYLGLFIITNCITNRYAVCLFSRNNFFNYKAITYNRWLFTKRYAYILLLYVLPVSTMKLVSCTAPLQKPRWLLEKSGLWPMECVTTYTIFKYFLNFFFDAIVLAIVLHNIVNAIDTQNINLLNWMTCVLLPLLNYYAKAVTLFVNRHQLRSILNDLACDTFNKHSEKLNRHVQSIYKISNLMIRYFAFVLTTFISIFGVLPILTNIRPIIPASFDAGKFTILYNIAHLFAVVFMGSISTAFDVLYMSFMALCSAQLDILKERLNNILEDAKEFFEDVVYKKQFYNIQNLTQHMLRDCVILHETINR